MSVPQAGLILCQQTRPNGNDTYYLKKGDPIVDPVLDAPVLVAPITIRSNSNPTTEGFIGIQGNPASQYQGAINITTGENTNLDAPARDAMTLVSEAAGSLVYVGADDVDGNVLAVNGTLGLSQVNDPVYNPAVSLKEITMVSTNVLCAPAAGNTGEIFRCAQAGVAASATAAIGNTFNVPKDGWYSLQMEVNLGNAPAPAAPDINVPITAVGTIDIGETLTFAITQGVVVQPYGAMECVSSEFLASSITQQGGNVIRQYVSQHLFQADVDYVFSLRSSSALWNIGTNGQIKAELIAMTS